MEHLDVKNGTLGCKNGTLGCKKWNTWM